MSHWLFMEILLDKELKCRLNLLESSIDILPGLCASENDLARSENEETDLGVVHVINQTWESIRVEIAVGRVVTLVKTFQLDFKVNGARTNHVLDLEIRQFDLIAHLLNRSSIVPGCFETQLFRLSTCNDHLASFED